MSVLSKKLSILIDGKRANDLSQIDKLATIHGFLLQLGGRLRSIAPT